MRLQPPKAMKEKLAKLLSILLGPQVWLPLLFTSFLFKTGLSKSQLLILAPVLTTLQVLLPLLYLYLAPKFGWASEWDLPKKEERYPLLLLSFIANLISIIVIYYIGTKLLFNLSLLFFVIFTIVAVITYFWKISLHVSLATIGSLMINFLFDWNMPYLYLSIPIIFWARLTLKKHSLTQLIIPLILEPTILFLSLYYCGYV